PASITGWIDVQRALIVTGSTVRGWRPSGFRNLRAGSNERCSDVDACYACAVFALATNSQCHCHRPQSLAAAAFMRRGDLGRVQSQAPCATMAELLNGKADGKRHGAPGAARDV